MCHIPVNIFPKHYLGNWSEHMHVIPEYAFAFECKDVIEIIIPVFIISLGNTFVNAIKKEGFALEKTYRMLYHWNCR